MKIKDILERGIEFRGTMKSFKQYNFKIGKPQFNSNGNFYLFGNDEFEGLQLRVMNMLEIALKLTALNPYSDCYKITVTVEDPKVTGRYCDLKILISRSDIKLIDSN